MSSLFYLIAIAQLIAIVLAVGSKVDIEHSTDGKQFFFILFFSMIY